MKERNWATKVFPHPRSAWVATSPYICRLCLGVGSFMLEWVDQGKEGIDHTLYYKLRGEEVTEYTAVPLTESTVTVEGLQNEVDYELYIERNDKSAKSNIRYVYPCEAGGYVINYCHPNDAQYFAGRYPATPHIQRLPSGRLIISHDVPNELPSDSVAVMFKSDDNGKTWQHLTEFYPMFWARMFQLNGKLYFLGTYGCYGDIVISVSEDEGETWAEPATLFRGDRGTSAGMHQSATPIAIRDGRLYAAFECGCWKLYSNQAYTHFIISAPVDADLLDKNSWDYTPHAFFDETKSQIPAYKFVTAIEGNAVLGPDGEIYNILRMDPLECDRSKPINKAILTKFVDFDHPLEFVQIIEPRVGLRHKFYTQYDEKTGYYLIVGNEETDRNPCRRSMISLSVSKDLRNWRKAATLFDCTDVKGQTYSYPSFIIDGDDLLVVSRSGFGKCTSEHDNNMVTFHKIENFRDLL